MVCDCVRKPRKLDQLTSALWQTHGELSFEHSSYLADAQFRLFSIFNKPNWIDADIPFKEDSELIQATLSNLSWSHKLN
jgi:hypothetical protein